MGSHDQQALILLSYKHDSLNKYKSIKTITRKSPGIWAAVLRSVLRSDSSLWQEERIFSSFLKNMYRQLDYYLKMLPYGSESISVFQ